MDECKTLIIIKGEDKTKDIESLNQNSKKIKVQYKNSEKEYLYYKENVLIRKQTKNIDVESKDVYYKNQLLFGVRKVIQFDEFIKIIYENGISELFHLGEISFESVKHDETLRAIMAYFKDISKYVKNEDEVSHGESFLKREYNKLNYVPNGSVLSFYLYKKELISNQEPIQHLIYPFGFNISQKKAVENVYKSNISIIEGPPGTGKTQTILNIIANAILQNKTVAVVSNNNEAVKNVKTKLKKNGYDFLVASLGRKEYREEFFERLPQSNAKNFFVSEERETLLNQITVLNQKLDDLLIKNNRKAELEKEISDYKLEQQYFNLYYQEENLDEIQKLSFYHKTENRILDCLVDIQMLYHGKVRCKRIHQLKLLFKYGIKDLKKLDHHLISYILDLQRDFYILKIKNLEQEYQKIILELKSHHFEDLQKEHIRLSNLLFKKYLYEKYNLKTNQFTIENYKSKMESFVQSFPIILSTTYSLRNSIPQDFMFDYVIIDEASQVDLLAGALALSVAKNAVIVGDIKQLPQIVDKDIKSELSHSKVDICYDYFEQNILSSLLSIYQETVPREILKEHYRCHPKIIEFCNKRYYDGKLISFANDEHLKVENPLVLYYTAEGNHMRRVNHGEYNGTYNQRELDVIQEEVLQHPMFTKYKEDDVGITTPYRLQANKMTEEVRGIIESDTIHKYQGREKKLMILSTVLDCSRLGQMGIKFVDDPHMINVAVSRAINQFILVTDHKLFKEKGKEIHALLKYIKYNSLDSEIIQSQLVSVFDLLYKEYSKKLDKLSKKLLHRSKYTSERIMDTILYYELKKEEYKDYDYRREVLLKNLIKSNNNLTEEEALYIQHDASIDFVIYDKMDKAPVLFIEVDGFAFHENNKERLKKDRLKDHIALQNNIKMLRFKTNGTYDEEKISGIIRDSLLSE